MKDGPCVYVYVSRSFHIFYFYLFLCFVSSFFLLFLCDSIRLWLQTGLLMDGWMGFNLRFFFFWMKSTNLLAKTQRHSLFTFNEKFCDL